MMWSVVDERPPKRKLKGVPAAWGIMVVIIPGRAGGSVPLRASSWSIPLCLCLSTAVVLQSNSYDTLNHHPTEPNVWRGRWSETLPLYQYRCIIGRFCDGIAKCLPLASVCPRHAC